MSENPLALSAAAHQATQAAAVQFQLAAAAPSQGYRLVYMTVPGCGDFHSYDNLRRAAKMGIQVQYMNVFHPGQVFAEPDKATGRIVAAPGQSLRAGTIADAMNYLGTKGLDVSEATHAVLLRPDNSVAREFNSTKDPNFLRELQRFTQSPPARSAGRA